MKLLQQSTRNGKLHVAASAAPSAGANQVLIANHCSVVSAGTEKLSLDLARKSLLGKARQRPDQVRRVVEKVRQEGIASAVRAVRTRLDQPTALGYAAAGVVIEVGQGVQNFKPGDRVASNGPHAELVCVPKNLCAHVPDNVPLESAAFTVLGAIALQGVRLAQVTLGETVLVVGLGLVGQLTVAVLKAAGCRVIGMDPDRTKCKLAAHMGADLAQPKLRAGQVEGMTAGLGADAVLITASTKSNAPIRLAADAVRKRGRVVLVGVVGLELDRRPFYFKECEFVVSCSYGPGRYDPQYEELGHDYPAAYVRWTEQRNMQAVLDLMASGRLDVGPLITHRFPIERAAEAYEMIQAGREAYVGVVLEYDAGGDGETDARFEIRDTGYEMRDAGYEMRDAGFEMRDAGFEMRDAGSEKSLEPGESLESRVEGLEPGEEVSAENGGRGDGGAVQDGGNGAEVAAGGTGILRSATMANDGTERGVRSAQDDGALRGTRRLDGGELGSGSIRVGVLGAGDFARMVMLPALKKHPLLQAEVVCSARGLSASHAADKFGFRHATADEDEVFGDERVRAVFVLTRHNDHARQVIKAIHAGKHVFVEKPLCLTLDELDAIQAELDAAGDQPPIVMVGFNRRFSPAAEYVRGFFGWGDPAADGANGANGAVRGSVSRRVFGGAKKPPLPTPFDKLNAGLTKGGKAAGLAAPVTVSIRFNAGAIPPDHWTQLDEIGGGRIVGEACHAVDLATYLCGSPPVRVFAESVGGTHAPAITDDQAFITLRHANGSISSIGYLAGGDRACGKERIEVIGGGRVAVIDDFRCVTTCENGKTKTKKFRGQDKGHSAEVEAFAQAVAGWEADGGGAGLETCGQRSGSVGRPATTTAVGRPATTDMKHAAAALGQSWPIPWSELRAVTLASMLAIQSLRKGVPMEVRGS